MKRLTRVLILLIIIVLFLFGIKYILDLSNNKDNNNDEEIVEINDPINEEEVIEEENKSKEEVIENYFDKEIESTETLLKEDNPSNESVIKEKFVKLTDFIFYNEEINGTTYSELKDETKKKLLDKWYLLDSKIENRYPNYKERISSTASDKYSKIKSKANELKELFKEKYVDDSTQERIDTAKEKANETKDKAVEKGKEIKDKLKSWYENYREEDD